MRRLLLLLSVVFFVYASWTVIEKKIAESEYGTSFETLKSEINEIKDKPEFSDAIEFLTLRIQEIVYQITQALEDLPQNEEQPVPQNQIEQPVPQKQIEQPNLETPSEQLFSILNIELGDTKDEAERTIGQAKRQSMNEYGTLWHTYHEDYQSFVMVSYDDNNLVTGLYTNQDLISSVNGIKLGSTKEFVLEQLGEPLNQINKGFVYYQFPEIRDYDMFELGNSYVTIFYDQHQQNTVSSIQVIKKELEQNRKDFYTVASEQLKEGFEYQLFDLTNATRVKHGINVLQWDAKVQGTARKHSFDMAENKFFDHTNLKGQSPFDRMLEDGIVYSVAGENLASGQFSSIFAHEGLMNSLGHRENILHPDFRLLGVGVAFNTESHPYYTEKFYAK